MTTRDQTDCPSDALFHQECAHRARSRPVTEALVSPLLDLNRSSPVNPITADQVRDARLVLSTRDRMLAGDGTTMADVLALQRTVVERFLAERRAFFGPEECAPLPEADVLAREGRDVFIVIKFMDEAPHIAATLLSLLEQKDVDPGRVVVLGVDNNSTDGSDKIFQRIAAEHTTRMRLVYLNQSTPGAGNAARLGVDRSIATVLAMCEADGDFSRLQTAVVGVSDGDTVYSPHLLRESLRIFDACPDVDAVMPFLTYKFAAALRMFQDYVPSPSVLPAVTEPGAVPAVHVDVDLSDATAFSALPRWRRRLVAPDTIELGRGVDGPTVEVPLTQREPGGRRYGVCRDRRGAAAVVFEDRTLLLERAPVSGYDAALVFLENGGIRPDEKWRWHSLIGHDLFLYWAFVGMGIPEEAIFPDTSDALKMIRVWSFAIGGQHQLRRADLRIATGSDYQSGRVLQVVGNVVRLGPAEASAETEIDRLIKMVCNFVRRQRVFYGETRGGGLDRATGLYVHMTRIQSDIEAELRGYPDSVFEEIVFPERVIFPLRWMLQNLVRFAVHGGPAEARIVREQVLPTIFTGDVTELADRWFGPQSLGEPAPHHVEADRAEKAAEQIIGQYHGDLMRFYVRTLESFFAAHHVPVECHRWLLDGVSESRNAINEPQSKVHPAAVWDGNEFDIDVDRGQVVRMRGSVHSG
ncbi:glycosyltransferase family A protein [Micromonospora sp. NPDC050980]|uniref:glycosyltransferase family A protein n=1 Tax=Micromonospora sp. NPDC050980 TaxID=3155161 RepID=UPI0033C62DDD